MTWREIARTADFYRQCLCAYNGDRFGVESTNPEFIKFSLWGGNFFAEHEEARGKSHELIAAKKKYSPLNRVKDFFIDGGKKRKRAIKHLNERFSALDKMIQIFQVNYLENGGEREKFPLEECREGIIYKTLKEIESLLQSLEYL